MDDQHAQYQYQSDKQWYGRVNSHQPGALYDNPDGTGIFDPNCVLPEGCENFILDQMDRFGLRITEDERGIAEWGGARALTFLDRVDPYVLFTRKLSDVSVSEDWTAHTYDISRNFGGKAMTIKTPPGKAESYCLAIPEGELSYRKFMASDYLVYANALRVAKHPVGDIAHSLRRTVQKELKRSSRQEILGCSAVGLIDFHFEFAAWAGLVWLLSPLSAEWRCYWSDLMNKVHDAGEAIFYQRNVFTRGQYRKVKVPGGHCYHKTCQIQSWCLSDTSDGRSLAKICEHCATLGMEPLPPANCGGQICRMPQCKHHPFFAFDPDRRLHETMRAHGQLVNKTPDPLLAGNSIPRDLLQ